MFEYSYCISLQVMQYEFNKRHFILYYIEITYYGNSFIYSMETNLKFLISLIKLTTPKIDYSLILNLEY